ncbi:putative glycolipid-binding domain-containing protein [Corynebacterium sp. H127]|uniref:putative glycolipid-binding domain-containing protein n=1 Tax=Corynebacterium sp. H127 TaxID=3133418 RepID=UPI0030A9C64D
MRHYQWLSLNDDSQRDTCDVEFLDLGLKAVGTQNTSKYQANWKLDASESWITQSIRVAVHGSRWARSLELQRDFNGIWSHSISETGVQPNDLPRPGIASDVDLSQALDVDLGKCPLTNVMPIRRLGLLEHKVARTPLVMAWIEMPSLRVISSDQYYSSLDQNHVRYESGTRQVDVTLSVDDFGVVQDYPNLARRTQEL